MFSRESACQNLCCWYKVPRIYWKLYFPLCILTLTDNWFIRDFIQNQWVLKTTVEGGGIVYLCWRVGYTVNFWGFPQHLFTKFHFDSNLHIVSLCSFLQIEKKIRKDIIKARLNIPIIIKIWLIILLINHIDMILVVIIYKLYTSLYNHIYVLILQGYIS